MNEIKKILSNYTKDDYQLFYNTVDELCRNGISCGCCEFYSQDKYCAYCLMLNEKLRYIDKDKDCPLIDIKTHDRELVKKVCEKIKVWCENIENWTNDCNHRVLSLDESNEFLNQIQKEFEK